MMGTTFRSFLRLPRDVSLEDLVPKDHFYRRLQTRLDLSFVRDLVRPLYAQGGRPSVDPVVFFKLQLVVFFEDIRSERQLMGWSPTVSLSGGTSATTSSANSRLFAENLHHRRSTPLLTCFSTGWGVLRSLSRRCS